MGPLQVGTTLSRKYKIERLLAESGGTVLYEATDTTRAQRVWIKILQRESLGNAAAMARFQREAAGAKVLDVGKNDAGLPYMVATEFGPDKPVMPPRPKAPLQKSSKTTLPGVAPPPPVPMASKPPAPVEVEEAAPISISGSDIVVDETPTPTPAPAAAGIFSTPPAASNPVLASPLVSSPPPKIEAAPEHDLPPFVEDPIVQLPAAAPSEPTVRRRKPASATPTVFIDRPKERSQTGVWLVAIVLASVVTGGAGWYFGHKDTRVAPAPPATTATITTTTVAAVATTEVKQELPPPPPPPPPATTTTTSPEPKPVETKTPPPPPVHTTRPPPVHTSRPPPHPPSGDPLTL